MANSLFIHFRLQVANCLKDQWPGGARWELIKKFSKELDGAWQNGRTPEYTAELIEEIFMSEKPVYVEENPTKLAKKWGMYHEVR
jgi:hypothetical protein